MFSYYMGSELVRSDSLGGESVLKNLWHHQDAILCCSLKVRVQFFSFKYVKSISVMFYEQSLRSHFIDK